MRPHAFPRSLRLRREADFRSIFRHGARISGARLLLVSIPNGLPRSRLGVSVRRKLAPRSVDRNRLKRIVREAFRLSRPELPAGFDFVVCPLALPSDFPLRAVREELVRLARSAAAGSAAPAERR